jgi:hypothetical protein
MGQAPERRFVEMVEVSVVSSTRSIAGGVRFATGPLLSFEEEEPVGEVGINQHVQVRELHQEGGCPIQVIAPGRGSASEDRFSRLARSPGQQRLSTICRKTSAG